MEALVQLLSTVPRTPDVITDVKTSVKQKEPMLDPRFEQHCSPAQLVRPDSSVMHVRLLRDTGALQSLVCSRVLTDNDYTPTGEFRLIRGITGDVISVPLVEVMSQKFRPSAAQAAVALDNCRLESMEISDRAT